MTGQDLIAAFEAVAEAPEGVTRLRELILELAVRGRLVPQDPSDEPASRLVPRLAVCMGQLVGRGDINQPRHPMGIPVDQAPYELPDTWIWLRVGDIGAVVGGGTPKSGESRYWADSDGIPWLTPADMRGQESRYVQRGERCITKEGLSESSAQVMPKGAVLFSSRAPIGHVGIAANPLATNQGFKSCVPYISVMSEYIYLYLLKAGPEINANATGTTFKEVSGKDVALVTFPLPPLAEQHRIVARVDELMGLLDRLEAARNSREATRTAVRDSALAALQDADTPDEVEVAWSRVAERMDDLFNDPADVNPLRQAVLQLAVRGRLVPGEFRTVALAALLREKLSNGRSVQDGSGYPVLRLTALRGRKVDVALRKTGAWSAEEGRRFRIEGGDILVVRGNGSRGLVARASIVERTEEVAFPDTAIRLRPDPGKVLPQYLYWARESPDVRSVLEEKAKTTAGIWKVSQGDLLDVCLRLPSLKDQHRIVAKVDELMGLLDRLEQRLVSKTTTHDAFAAAAVHHLDA